MMNHTHTHLICLFSLLFTMTACCNTPKVATTEEILAETHAVKTLNTYDEMDCVVYEMKGLPESSQTSIDRFVSDDCVEGKGSFELKYSFSGSSSTPESVYLQQTGGDYRSDLSFHPTGLSIWVKGHKNNKGTFRLMLIQDIDMFTQGALHDQDRWQFFEYVNKDVLTKEEWTRVVIPYDAFTFVKGRDSGDNKLALNRLEGYRIEITNDDNSVCTGQLCIDNLEQLTSYVPNFKGSSKFSSVFIQLHPVYQNTNWDEEFKASREVGIDTWIIQYAEGFDEHSNQKTSFYTPTRLPWVNQQYDLMNRMFEAAKRNDMKLIIGLYPGDYSREDTTTPEQYELLVQRNKQVFDELFALWGEHPNLAGWYITEEFHDGSYPVGWQQEPALSLLANYLQTVAAYVKSKSSKEVSIAPALWRGMPADLCGEWFGKIFSQTPDIDMLYLQDIGGRCLVDFDVDLPNWFAEIKKACDANGVAFGVDVESFKNCWCPDISMRAKTWVELEEQLKIAGMFTEHITNFSWATFKPGTDTYEGYKKYLNRKD